MKTVFARVALSAFAVVALTAAASEPVAIENAGDKQSLRIPDFADVSGVTWKGGSSFYIVRDGGNTVSNACSVHVMTVPLDGNGRMFSSPLMSPGVHLVGARDAEGIAYDSCSGNVWISDEAGARIGEYDPESGQPTGRAVPVPEFVTKNIRDNLSLEALTISGDGLTMWTANEEALLCDGASARPKASTVVRLMRFVRRSSASDWEPAGMWAYPCDPVGNREPVYSGVSDLCALPDGSLLVLERECSYSTLGRTRIYRPDFSGATDVGGFLALTNRAYVSVAKGKALYEAQDGQRYGDGFLKSKVSCYEGLCLGPGNADGSVNLMLVSDGGATRSKEIFFLTVSVETKSFVRSLRLDGLDVCTLAFEPSETGRSDFTGSCYRYLRGTSVSVNCAAPAASAEWTLPAHGLSGKGTNATFVVSCDDRLYWLSPEALAARGSRKDERPREVPLRVAADERPWRLGVGGFGRGYVRRTLEGYGSDRVSVYGAEMDLQYSLLEHGPYDLSLGLGGSYCPQQGDAFDSGATIASRGQMDIGYGEARLLVVPQRCVTEDLSFGLRLGVAFDWLNASASEIGASGSFSDSDTEFAAQGILGVQATWFLTDRLGIYSNFDWRLGAQTEFETRGTEATVDLSGWFWGVGAFFTF